MQHLARHMLTPPVMALTTSRSLTSVPPRPKAPPVGFELEGDVTGLADEDDSKPTAGDDGGAGQTTKEEVPVKAMPAMPQTYKPMPTKAPPACLYQTTEGQLLLCRLHCRPSRDPWHLWGCSTSLLLCRLHCRPSRDPWHLWGCSLPFFFAAFTAAPSSPTLTTATEVIYVRDPIQVLPPGTIKDPSSA